MSTTNGLSRAMESALVRNASELATQKHADQKRKYTGKPYIVHPQAVASIVAELEWATPEMVAASLLHDVPEETGTSLDEIASITNNLVAKYVYEVSGISRREDGNRKARKMMDLKHYARGCMESQTIKIADVYDNFSCESMRLQAPAFAKLYKAEKLQLLKALTKGDSKLRQNTLRLVRDY